MNLRNIFRFIIFAGSIILAISFVGCRTSHTEKNKPVIIISNPEGNGYQFELNFQKGKNHHYPLMAIWIEDLQGNYIQTLFVARSVGKGEYARADITSGKWSSGPLRRAATLPYWAHKRNTVEGNEDPFPNPTFPVNDAYTGATPKGDFKLQAKGDHPISSPFRIWFEINQFFDFNNFWTNNKFPDDQDYKTSGQPAILLVSDPIYPEKLPQSATFTIIGHSHYSGKNGNIYTSLQTLSSAMNIVGSIRVDVSER